MRTEMEETYAMCDNCLSPVSDLRVINEELGQITKAVFFCKECGRKVDMFTAYSLAQLAFSMGETVINNGIASLLIRRFKHPLLHPKYAFPMRLSGETAKANLLAALRGVDFVSAPGCVSKDAIYKEGMHLLRIFLENKTKWLKSKTGENFIPIWVNAILLATYARKFVDRKNYPEFGSLITQRLSPGYLGKKFVLSPDLIGENDYSLDPVLSNSERDIYRAIKDGKVQVFRTHGPFSKKRGSYGFNTLGGVGVEFKELKNTGDGIRHYVPEVTVQKFPAAVLFPNGHIVWIFY